MSPSLSCQPPPPLYSPAELGLKKTCIIPLISIQSPVTTLTRSVAQPEHSQCNRPDLGCVCITYQRKTGMETTITTLLPVLAGLVFIYWKYNSQSPARVNMRRILLIFLNTTQSTCNICNNTRSFIISSTDFQRTNTNELCMSMLCKIKMLPTFYFLFPISSCLHTNQTTGKQVHCIQTGLYTWG